MTITKLLPKRLSFYLVVLLSCSSLYMTFNNFLLRTTVNAAASQATQFAKDMSTLKQDNKKLKTQNEKLTKANTKLKARHASIKDKVKRRHKTRTKTLVARMGKKMATAPARMVPIAGIGFVVTATAADIHSSCSDIASMAEFETELFNEVIPAANESEPVKLCGVDVESELQQSALAVENKVKHTFDITQTKYNEMSIQLGGFLNDLYVRNSKTYNEFKHDLGGFMHELKKKMKTREPKEIKPVPAPLPILYDDTPFDYLNYLNYFNNEYEIFNRN